jgi:membrane protein
MRRALAIARDAYRRFDADDGWAIASHIALSALMAMFPFFIVLTSVAGFLGYSDLADEVAKLMLAVWPEEVALPIAREIQRVLTTTHTGVFTLGLVFAVYFASSGVESLRIGLNRATTWRRRGTGFCCGSNPSPTCCWPRSGCWRSAF